MSKLEGRIALVTGASKGIGAGIARELAAAGATVVVNYATDRTGADAVVQQITSADGRAVTIQGDVSKSNDVSRLFAEVKQMQAEQNTAAAKAHQDFVTLNSKVQTERSNLNQQFKELEQDRRDLHRVRRSELAWSESFRFLAIVIAAVTPLFLCAYLIWAACRPTGCHQDVNELLMGELVSPTPRLIASPNLRGIEHRSDQHHSIPKTTGDNPNDVTRRTDQIGNP